MSAKVKVAATNIGVNRTTGRPLFKKGDVVPDTHPELDKWIGYGMVQEIGSLDELEEQTSATALQFSLPIKADAPSAPPVEETEEMTKTREAARTLQTKEDEQAKAIRMQTSAIEAARKTQEDTLLRKLTDENNKASATPEEERKKIKESVEKAQKNTERLKKKSAQKTEEEEEENDDSVPTTVNAPSDKAVAADSTQTVDNGTDPTLEAAKKAQKINNK